jgi:hypothetical protein
MHQPAMTSRTTGQTFEAAAERFARKTLKLSRPGEGVPLSTASRYTLLALRPQNRPDAFERQTCAEGLWVTRAGGLVWVECVGSIGTTYRPGLRRSDSTRKLGGTLNAVLAVCRYWQVAVPKVVLVTTHCPAERSGAAEYLYWAVVAPFGRDNVELWELDPAGTARHLALPTATAFI